MATITLKIVAAEMRDYNRRVAPGSECAAWQDFVADCFRRYDVAPWEDAAEEIEALVLQPKRPRNRLYLANVTMPNKMVNRAAPHYINEHQSDMRGIKDGWYAMEKDGNLVAGPFSSRKDCLKLLNPISAGSSNAHASIWTQTPSSFDDFGETLDQNA